MRGLEGKVAFITGAARGQGRSHALRLAQEGVRIVAADICQQIESVPYPLSSTADLDETIALVEKEGGQILARRADVRDRGSLAKVLDEAWDRFGRLDIVVANAGVAPLAASRTSTTDEVWDDVLAVNLTGVWNTVVAAIPKIIEGSTGGSLVLTSSTAGLKGLGSWSRERGIGSWTSAGGPAYSVSKHGVVGIMRSLAVDLAPHSIRVNTIHPTGVNTPMIVNDAMKEYLAAQATTANAMTNALPVDMIEASDVSDAVAWLVSDEARYVTGVALPVDAGYLVC